MVAEIPGELNKNCLAAQNLPYYQKFKVVIDRISSAVLKELKKNSKKILTES